MTQLALSWFDECADRSVTHPPRADNHLSRRTDPQTSKQAAARTDEFRARDIAKINAALRDSGPMTAYEIAAETGLDHVAVSRRMSEMVERKLVRDPDSYAYDTRPSPKGRQCIVWVAR